MSRQHPKIIMLQLIEHTCNKHSSAKPLAWSSVFYGMFKQNEYV